MKDYNLKTIKQDFKSKGIFYTTKDLALYLKSFLPDDVKEIYDPTCGNGGLLSVFDDDVEKYGQDINEEQVQAARENLKNFHGVVGDTLAEPAFTDRKFKYIIANPPFSIKWEQQNDERFEGYPCLPPKSKADYAFIAHILHCLTDDGIAVVLNFPGILYRGQSEGKIRKYLVEKNFIDTVAMIDGGHFVDTKIATVMLILKKNRNTTDITFLHNDEKVVVPLSEIINNDYNLSTNNYIIEEVEREEVDLNEVNRDVRKGTLAMIKSTLDMEKMIADLDGTNISGFINEIRKLLDEYEVQK